MLSNFYILFSFIYKGDKKIKSLEFGGFILLHLKNKQSYIVVLSFSYTAKK